MTKTEKAFHGGKRRPLAWLAVLCCAALPLLLAQPAAAAGTLEKIAQSGTISLGFRDPAIPFSYLDGDKRPEGYSIDICMKVVEAIRRELKRTDLAVKFVEVDSLSRMSALNDGTIDMECSSTAVTADRTRQFGFAIPAYIATIRVMVPEGSGIRGTGNLVGKTVVTTQGASSEKVFKDLNQVRSLHAKLILGKDHGESFALLESGKADAFILDDVLLYSLRAAHKEPTKFTITRDALAHEPFSIMLRKDDVALKKIVDTEIVRLIRHGEIRAIYHKWFESPIPYYQVNLKMPSSYMLNEFFKSPREWQVY